MQSTLINSTILNNYEHLYLNFGNKLGDLITRADHWYSDRPYFFLRRELTLTPDTWKSAKDRGMVRHCKIHNGKFLDYIAGNEYDTIEEWVTDAGGKLEDVLYGVNRVHKRSRVYNYILRKFEIVNGFPQYIELSSLLKALGYTEPPKVDTTTQVQIPVTTTQNLTELITLEMRLHGLTIDNVYVLNNGAITPWNTFMNK